MEPPNNRHFGEMLSTSQRVCYGRFHYTKQFPPAFYMKSEPCTLCSYRETSQVRIWNLTMKERPCSYQVVLHWLVPLSQVIKLYVALRLSSGQMLKMHGQGQLVKFYTVKPYSPCRDFRIETVYSTSSRMLITIIRGIIPGVYKVYESLIQFQQAHTQPISSLYGIIPNCLFFEGSTYMLSFP